MTDIKQLAEVCDLVQTESESQTATLAERVLTPEAQAERDDFQAEYGYDGNCSCHISPPCNSCIHPGNPRNQEEDEAAWVADGCGACGDACASNGGDCRVKEESPPVCESVQAGGESQTGQSDDPALHALGVMTRVASAARDLLHESEEFDFPDGLGRGAPQRLWDALGSEIEAAENDGAPIDDVMPPADPALLASANRMLSDRLERVAHVLRGCGLPALADISDQEDLQMAAAALSGAYQMALADAEAVPDLRNTVTELDATVTLQRETLVVAASDVSRLSNELATERRVSGSAMSAVASICEHLGCDDHNGHVPVLRAIDDLRAQIASLTADVMRTRGSLNSAINEADRLRAELAVERQACKTLQESASTAPVRAATSFIVRAAKRKPRTFSSIEKAREAAMAAIRAGAQRAEVCPMLPPVGVARKGAEWRAA